MHIKQSPELSSDNKRKLVEIHISKNERMAGKLPHNVEGGSTFIEVSEDGVIVGFFDEPNGVWRDVDGNIIPESSGE